MSDPSDIAHRTSHIALVTGTLAERAARRVAGEIAGYTVHVMVLPIQVAALLTTQWVGRKLRLPEGVAISRVILPGYCRGELEPLTQQFGVPFELGPYDVHDLPTYLGQSGAARAAYGSFDLQIIAEINHAPRVDPAALVAMARALAADGADVIDLGCDPSSDRDAWPGVADAVRALRDAGLRVSIDSFHPAEVAAACRAGAELVLSVNSGNVQHAREWGVEVVVIPDAPDDLASLDRSIERLVRDGVRFRIDPIVEPLGFGFARSLGRYLRVRGRYPQAAMMMGVGNLTEMTQVDSAGVNALLVGFCQELGIGSVLTTQVINWARSSVKEIDVARRLMFHAVSHGVPPKHLDDRMVTLRDPRLREIPVEELRELAGKLTDRNVRMFTSGGEIHAMHRDAYAHGVDPFPVFDALGIDDPSHAFYLGYEMAKAVIALTLSKNYTQDEPLRFGHLTRAEVSHHERRKEGRR